MLASHQQILGHNFPSPSQFSIFIALFFIPLGDSLGFPGGSDGKESACNMGDLGSIPGLGRLPRGGHGNPL